MHATGNNRNVLGWSYIESEFVRNVVVRFRESSCEVVRNKLIVVYKRGYFTSFYSYEYSRSLISSRMRPK